MASILDKEEFWTSNDTNSKVEAKTECGRSPVVSVKQASRALWPVWTSCVTWFISQNIGGIWESCDLLAWLWIDSLNCQRVGNLCVHTGLVVVVVHVWSLPWYFWMEVVVGVTCGTLEIAWCCHILDGPRLSPLAVGWDFDSNTAASSERSWRERKCSTRPQRLQ